MKYFILGLFALNVYLAFQGYTLNAFAAGFMAADYVNLFRLQANT